MTVLSPNTQAREVSSFGGLAPEPDVPSWTLLSNHAHVLVVIAQNPDARQRDIASVVGVTIGAVQRIVHELEDAGYLLSEKVGRRNHYKVLLDTPLRHPLENKRTVGELIAALT